MRVGAYVQDSAFVDPQHGVGVQRLWLAVLRSFAERVNPGFGQIEYGYAGSGTTGLEFSLPPDIEAADGGIHAGAVEAVSAGVLVADRGARGVGRATRGWADTPGCALRAGRKSCATPRVDLQSVCPHHSPPRATRTTGFGTAVMPSGPT